MDGLRVGYTPAKGRHLVCTKAFAAGSVVLRQQPYAAVLYDDAVPARCDYCFAVCEASPPLRCGRSKFARYCCREHQRLAWREWFRQECDALVATAPRVPPPTVRLAARVLQRHARSVRSAVQSCKGKQGGSRALLSDTNLLCTPESLLVEVPAACHASCIIITIIYHHPCCRRRRCLQGVVWGAAAAAGSADGAR